MSDRHGITLTFEADVMEWGSAPLVLTTDFFLADGSTHREIVYSPPIGEAPTPPPATPTPPIRHLLHLPLTVGDR